MNDIELLPCPFCGSEAEKLVKTRNDSDYLNYHIYDVGCTNDECYLCEGADWAFDNFEEVAKFWNTRK